MNIKQETIDFLTENLCETRASYYINLFRSMSEREFTDRIEKYCYLASKYEREHFLGKLDGDSTLLLITAMIMRNAIYRRENNLIHSDGVSIYASKSEIEKAREDYEEAEGQISKASKDYLKAKNKLFQNIQKSFEKELSFSTFM